MIPDEELNIRDYAKYDIETQVHLQIALVKKYTSSYYDASFSSMELKEAIVADMLYDLAEYEKLEKYELCMLFRDAIENIRHIPVHKLY